MIFAPIVLCCLMILSVMGRVEEIPKAPKNFPVSAWEYAWKHAELNKAAKYNPWISKTKRNQTTSPHLTAISPHSNRIQVDITAYPYQVSMTISGQHICGGSLVHLQWVLTAAHCSTSPVSYIKFRLGSTDRTTGVTIISASQRFVHPGWDRQTLDYDATLYKLLTPAIAGPNIATIPLPASTLVLPAGTNATVSGWGIVAVDATALPTNLMAVNIAIVSPASCQAAYGQTSITDSMICAGLPSGAIDTCQGDSGGPLVTLNGGVTKLIGIVSWGAYCSLPGFPGVYTDVTSLRAWIQSIAGV